MSEKLKITFLGTSDAVPSANRNHSAILLTYGGENILVDCGEGTQRQMRKAKINPCKLTRILITHWHGDHVLGIPGLLQTLVLSDYHKKLYIYGPRGTKKFMKKVLDTFIFVGKYKIEVKEVTGKFFENKNFYLEAKPMTHGVPVNAYSFVEKEKTRIDKKKLAKHKIVGGPHLAKIKEGKDIVVGGKKLKTKDLTFKEQGKKVSIILDSAFNKNMASFAKDSNILIIESSFDSSLEKRAKEYHHMTSKQCGVVAKQAKVKKLILTHISSRYEHNQDKILNEAKKVFRHSSVAKDLEVLEL